MTIPNAVERTLEAAISTMSGSYAKTLEDIIEADQAARRLASRFCVS
jgi:hypothetical protein